MRKGRPSLRNTILRREAPFRVVSADMDRCASASASDDGISVIEPVRVPMPAPVMLALGIVARRNSDAADRRLDVLSEKMVFP